MSRSLAMRKGSAVSRRTTGAGAGNAAEAKAQKKRTALTLHDHLGINISPFKTVKVILGAFCNGRNSKIPVYREVEINYRYSMMLKTL